MVARAPSLARLKAAFPTVDETNLVTVRQIIRGEVEPETVCEATAKWVGQCYHRPRWHERAMHAIDVLIEGFGVEALGRAGSYTQAAYEYSNQGDTYTSTIIYNCDKDSFYIGCWGDLAERHGDLV